MTAVIQNFEQKLEEIDTFFKLLKTLEDPDLILSFPTRKSHRTKRLNPKAPSILRASAFLMIYNLIEAAIRDGFTAIYDKIKAEGRNLTDLRLEIRELWVEQQHRGLDSFSASQRNFQEKAKQMINSIISGAVVEMEGTKLPVSGNMDGQAVREVCARHGIAYKINRAAQGGFHLATVKTQRNALAHGSVSFAECGRQFSTGQLELIKNQAAVFVRSVLTNMRRFASRARYIA